jgi:DNA-binding NarL/FixJ family response regulator
VIRVLIVDDHALFRESLAFLLQREPDITVIGQAGTLAEARGLLAGVDVALLDLDLPDGNGRALIRGLHALNPHGTALVLTASTARPEVARAVEAGAAGVLQKSASPAALLSAVRRLRAGESLLAPREVSKLLGEAIQERERERETRAVLGQLTGREREVLQVLAEGLSDKEIAQRLHVSLQTVHTHMAHILSKLGVESRLRALVYAARCGAVRLG